MRVEKKKEDSVDGTESCYARATTQLSKFHTLAHVCTHIQSNVNTRRRCKYDLHGMGRGGWVSYRFFFVVVRGGE